MALRIFVLLAALAGMTGCTTQQVLNSLTTDTGYTIASNITFDSAFNLRLDVYTPHNVQNAPVVVFFYGGRWSSGSKDEYKFVGQALTSQGFVVVIADYRKYPQVRFPAFVRDGANAVRWTHDNIGQYGGDPGKLFVMGFDSGAHIAAMLALDPEYLKAVGDSNRSWLKGMIGLAGPYDFMPITAPDLRDLFGPPEQFAQSQPIMYVDGKNPPLLLMTGMDDDSVLPKNTLSLASAVSKSGGVVETVTYPHMSHSMILATIAAPLRKNSDVLAYVTSFIRRRSVAAPVAQGQGGVPLDDIQIQPLEVMPPPASATQVQLPPPTPLPAPVPVPAANTVPAAAPASPPLPAPGTP
ncbi:MAG: alpha/beta hydrolase [Stenotrophobium sp.]